MSEPSPTEMIANLEARQDSLLAQLRELNNRIELALAQLAPAAKAASSAAETSTPPHAGIPATATDQTPLLTQTVEA